MARTYHRKYQPAFYDTLPDYADAEKVVPPDEFLEAAGAVFKKWGLSDFIAVSLLHKHFEVAADEYLIRRFFADKQCIIGKSQKVPEEGSTVEYMWRYMVIDGEVCLCPVEFISSTDDLKNMGYHALMVRLASGFHEDYHQVLSAFELQDVFGITLLPGILFDLSGKRSLVENSDETEFVLRPEQPGDDRSEGTQTIWAYPSINEPHGLICIGHVCGRHTCGRHTCNVHCKVHCKKHCGQHVRCRKHHV